MFVTEGFRQGHITEGEEGAGRPSPRYERNLHDWWLNLRKKGTFFLDRWDIEVRRGEGVN